MINAKLLFIDAHIPYAYNLAVPGKWRNWQTRKT
jgi:hypothetical protein